MEHRRACPAWRVQANLTTDRLELLHRLLVGSVVACRKLAATTFDKAAGRPGVDVSHMRMINLERCSVRVLLKIVYRLPVES